MKRTYKKRPKRLVAECANEFHTEVNKYARKNDFKSAGAFIIFACQAAMAAQKQITVHFKEMPENLIPKKVI